MAGTSTAAEPSQALYAANFPRFAHHLLVGLASPRRAPWRRSATTALHVLANCDWIHVFLDNRDSDRIWLLSASIHRLPNASLALLLSL
jgi:hypothetical protein